jgi:hypothetical protein
MNTRKIELAVFLVIFGWLSAAFVRAVQVEAKVSDHDDAIKSLSIKIDKISSDVSFIRGKLEINK